MRISKCSIAMKIILSSSISLFLVVVTALWTYYLSNQVQALADIAKHDGVVLTRTAQQMDKDVIQIQQRLTDISATRGLNGLDAGLTLAEESYQSMLSGLAIFEQHYKKSNEVERLGEIIRIRQLAADYYAHGKKMARAYIEHGPAEGNKSMKLFNAQAEQLSAAIKPFIEQHYGMMIHKLENVSGAVAVLMKAELLVFILIGISIVGSAYIILRLLMASMRRSQAVIERLARGELTGTLEVKTGKDEMGKLMSALDDLYQHLQVIVGGVNDTSDQIRNTAYAIANDNTQLADSTARQTQTLHETAGSMAQITESVKNNAENAQRASQLANTATEVAREGALAITNTIGSMGQVDASSKKISEITAVIDSIAFQTNLLALNASVEAARAGDNGRGFAVVANEVRNLAQRSAASAKEIKALIEESVIRVDAFSQEVDASGEALAEIVGAVREVSEVVEKIAQASREQSVGVVEVNRAIKEMNAMTENNNDAVMQAADYSARLKQQADHLSNLMNFFKVVS